MKKVFLLFAIVITYSSYAQDANTGSRISVGFNFSPDYDFRTIRTNENGNGTDLTLKSRNDREIAKTGYTTGLNVAFKLSNSIAFETGLQYSNKGYQTKETELVFETNPLLPSKGRFHYSYQYLGIPLKLNMVFGEGNIRFVSGIGVTTNFLLNVQNRNNFEYADGKKETTKSKSTDGFNRIDVSPMIRFGIDYKLTNAVNLRVEPTFRYGIIKTTSTPVSENLWNAGLNLGVNYQL